MANVQPIIIKKKKISAGHGHHGGAWKVAYADFVTAMMCFFLVMWLMGADDDVKQAIEHYFNHPNTPYKAGADPNSNQVKPMGEQEGSGDNVLAGAAGEWPDDLLSQPIPARNPMKENRILSVRIEKVLKGKVYGMDVNPNNIRFSLSERLLFKPGSTQLEESAIPDLETLADLLKDFSGFIHIEGHTDETPPKHGRYANNWELSFARALAVMHYFVNVHKYDEKKLIPIGRGSRHPISLGTDLESRRKNRRVEFVLSYETPAE